jgi:electron transfer flavoprotein beta subunit
MDIVVCLKQIIDPVSVEVNSLTGKVNEERLVRVTNPADLCALEEALRIKDKYGGKITVLGLGPAEMNQSLKEALAMGADQAFRIWDDDWENISAPDLVAYALGKVIKKQRVDLILCGDRGDSFHVSEVPAWLSEYLNMPLITGIVELTLHEKQKSFKAKRKLEKGRRQVLEGDLPAVLAVTEFLNEPREYDLPNFLKIYDQEIQEINLPLVTVKRMMPQSTPGKICYQVQNLRPKPQLIFTPDSSLTGAERIEALVSGGMSGKKTEYVRESPKESALRIIALLKENEMITGKKY